MNQSKTEQFTWPQAFAYATAILALLVSSVLMAQEAEATSEERVTVNSFFANEGREQNAPDKVSKDERAPMAAASIATAGSRDRSGLRSSKAAAGATTKVAPNIDFWFYEADVELFRDDDRDGYFAGIDLLFDADTTFIRAEVFAVAYLSYEGGPWEEYAETDDFVINGSSANDEYVIVSDLVSGYPRGSYDILIELFDAFDGSFVADIGPENTSELAFLPLEDAARDDAGGSSPPPVVINQGGGGGAADLWTIAMLLSMGLAAAAIRRRRQPRFSH
ncbi:MAG: choice-of-anchor H family protein [Gammaproteobacteria bacterium]|nr:choice-of-anchor H family protein [Gammaproteobacteria bacterium]